MTAGLVAFRVMTHWRIFTNVLIKHMLGLKYDKVTCSKTRVITFIKMLSRHFYIMMAPLFPEDFKGEKKRGEK